MYSAVLPAIVAQLKAQLPPPGVTDWLDYEPRTVQVAPLGYVLFDSFARTQPAARLVRMHYRMLARLCFRWVDVEQAEHQLRPYVNAVPNAIYADRSLGGVCAEAVHIEEGAGKFIVLGGVLLRTLDTYIIAPMSGVEGSGI